MTLGNRIKQARIKAGLTQKELAQKLNLAEITIRQYETDKRQPRIEFLNKISDALDINTWELYDSYLLRPNNDYFLEKMDFFRKELNDRGQEKAVEQVELLTKIPEYQKEN